MEKTKAFIAPEWLPGRRVKSTKKKERRRKNHETVRQKTKIKKKILSKKLTRAERRRKTARDTTAARFGQIECAACRIPRNKRDFSQKQLTKITPKCRSCTKPRAKIAPTTIRLSHDEEKKTVALFTKYLSKCRPVWTLTWRDSAAPSFRSGVPEVREEDVYFNRQVADNYIQEFSRKTLAKRVKSIKRYLSSAEGTVTYKVSAVSGYRHKVLCSKKNAGSYFLSCILYEKRHNHALKFTNTKKL